MVKFKLTKRLKTKKSYSQSRQLTLNEMRSLGTFAIVETIRSNFASHESDYEQNNVLTNIGDTFYTCSECAQGR